MKARYVNRKKVRNRFIIILSVVGVCVLAAAATLAVMKLQGSLSPVGGVSSGANSPATPIVSAASSGASSASAPSLTSPAPSAIGEAPSSAPESSAAIVAKGDYSDAAFLGDSRTEALKTYGVLKDATYFCYKGLKVDTAFTDKVISQDGQKLTVMDALAKKQFKRVYTMLGVNELGWYNMEKFIGDYTKIIDGIKASQPNATIYVQAILPVSKKKSDGDKIYNNPKIDRFNGLIKKMAEDTGTTFLEVNKAVAGDDGALPVGASTDGVHPNIDYCRKWAAYLDENS